MTRESAPAHFGRSASLRFLSRLLLSLLLLITALVYANQVTAESPRAQSEPLAPTACPSNLTFGATIDCSINSAGEVDSFTFSGTTGSRIRVAVAETSGSLSAYVEILRPNGTTLCETILGKLTCPLNATGTYTVLVYDFGGSGTGAYGLHIQRLNNPAGCSPINPFGGLPATGSIGMAAEYDCFTFHLAAGDRVRVRTVETSGSLSAFMEMVGTDGTTICETILDAMTCTVATTGTFTVLVYAFNGTSTGSYSLYVQRLNGPVGCTSIGYNGTSTNGAINVAAETDCYTFDGATGNRVRTRAVESSGNLSVYTEVLRPDGTTLCNTILTELTCQLDANGTHTIMVYDFGGTNTGQYALTLTCLTPPCGGNPISDLSFYASAAGSGTVGGVAFAPADILAFDGDANTWSMYFDGSDVGVTKNLGAFAFDGNDLLIGFAASQTLPGLGAITAWDAVRFDPTSTGNNTVGAFTWYFDGSDVGLTAAGEKIDALGLAEDGRLLISTTGAAKVPGNGGTVISAQDEDLLVFNETSLGDNTAGYWQLYFNATALTGMGVEDINGFWEDGATGDRYVTILGTYNLGGVTGDGKDIVKLTPSGGAPGGYAPSLVWDGSAFGFPSTLDAVEIDLP